MEYDYEQSRHNTHSKYLLYPIIFENTWKRLYTIENFYLFLLLNRIYIGTNN